MRRLIYSIALVCLVTCIPSGEVEPAGKIRVPLSHSQRQSQTTIPPRPPKEPDRKYVPQGKIRVPHKQSRPPNPPRSPEAAVAMMQVPPGFSVEIVAAEPDIVNPIAMTFDDRGRIWITESLEYPRRSAGPGRDRVKILEDTNGDGRADKITIFADDLNIPSGIAVGYGGVWVANSPDILFLQDTDGDGKADTRKVVVTGFGRKDTHELPNSLTWGPDGWLYGLNGVFNEGYVRSAGKGIRFTCAMFRINPRPDPRTGEHAFELFAAGTSNPWGIAWDKEGSAFASACVIDHLWHLSESGYYHRQAGAYPPFTWKIGSIVEHRHQKAAYCGLTYFDSDAYPEEYREVLYMGNIHGGSINADKLSRRGSTYRGQARPDFLTANDAWFMPVAQKTGPDGCLYVLDWYDRYHCYQDAKRDPAGVDRGKGRLYRIRYQQTPRAPKFDLSKAGDDQLITHLGSPNIYFRETAQRLLAERNNPKLRNKLERLVLDKESARKARMHALWALIGAGPLRPAFHYEILAASDPGVRAWAVRAAGNRGQVTAQILERVTRLADDESPDVRLQVAIAAVKIKGVNPLALLVRVLANSDKDPLIPQIVWQNLHPLLENRADEYLRIVETHGYHKNAAVANLMPRVTDRLLAAKKPNAAVFVRLFKLLRESGRTAAAGRCLAWLTKRVQNRLIPAAEVAALRSRLEPLLQEILATKRGDDLFLDAAMLLATWRGPEAGTIALEILASQQQSNARRMQALEALMAAGQSSGAGDVLNVIGPILLERSSKAAPLRKMALSALGRLDNPRIASVVLQAYPRLEPSLRPLAIELLTQRAAWGRALMQAIAAGVVPKGAVNLNQVRKMMALGDAELQKSVAANWGQVRTRRNANRERVIQRVRRLVMKGIAKADVANGQRIFQGRCSLCHVLHGAGTPLGPDITVNGRGSFEQLLSNVLDPNLVIGPDYQARLVKLKDKRMLIGILVEQNAQQIVLRLPGGKDEVVARRDIAEITTSPLSLMPEGLEAGLTDQQIVDLFTYLSLERPPGDPEARLIPGIRRVSPQRTSDPKRFKRIFKTFAPGFSTKKVGEGGVAILEEHFGRQLVLRTHPVSRNQACIIRTKRKIPAGKSTFLLLGVSHHGDGKDGDWQLIVKANGKVLHDSIIGQKSTVDHWADLSIDLSAYAGRTVNLEIHNRANNWNSEFAYWSRIEIVSK